MSPLVERNEFATLVGELTFGYCGKLAWFGLFFELYYQSSRGGILHERRKPTQTVNGFLKQFSHNEHHNI
jgi:hypothetical protein